MSYEKNISDAIMSLMKDIGKPMSITDMAKIIPYNRHTISRYLDRLYLSGKVDLRQHGQKKKYFLPNIQTWISSVRDSPYFLLLLNIDYTISWANETFLKLSGLSLKEVMGENIFSLPGLFLNSPDMNLYVKNLMKGGSTIVELSVDTGGETRFFLIALSYISVMEHQPVIVVTGEDITEKKELEQLIQESEQNFRIMAENVNDLIIRLTPEGIIIYASPACIHLTRFFPEELLGKPASIFIHPEEQNQFNTIFQNQNHDQSNTRIAFVLSNEVEISNGLRE